MSQRTDSTAGLSEQQFAAILGREAAATPGPWAADHTEIYRAPHGQIDIEQWIGETLRIDNEAGSNADAEFIAHVREDVPALLAEVDRLRTLVDEMHAAAVGHSNGPLLGYVEDMRGVRDAVNAQTHRGDTLNRLARERRGEVGQLRAADPWQRLTDALNALAGADLDAMPLLMEEDGTVRDCNEQARIVWEPSVERFHLVRSTSESGAR